MTVSERNSIRLHRQRAGVTLQWLAKRMRSTVMEIDKLERGELTLTPKRADAIAKVLRILPYHIVGLCDCTAAPPPVPVAPAPPPPPGVKSHART